MIERGQLKPLQLRLFLLLFSMSGILLLGELCTSQPLSAPTLVAKEDSNSQPTHAFNLASASLLNPSTSPSLLPSLISQSSSPSWAIAVGKRIVSLRENVPILDRVVLVPDEATFLAAIQDWSLEGRYPILIEDEKYAPLFLKRFQPGEVIRLPSVKTPLPTGKQRQELMTQVVAKAWNATDEASLKAQWQKLDWQPPGVVITSSQDPAWLAAVALAADRGQPLAFIEGDFGSPNDSLSPVQWQQLKTQVQQAVANTGHSYLNLGDTIDTVTISRQLAVKYSPGEGSLVQLAVTDGLARLETGDRWAVVGWIYGSPARSVYQAMSSIFLNTETAFLYDSYQKTTPWSAYQLNSVADSLKNLGIEVQITQQPEANLQGWRKVTANGIDADLMFINSSGGAKNFNVGGQDATVSDIPKLNRPAAIHFIHSFSATTPGDPETVAGRWLDNGAHAYVGSVHEPYLSAFMPPNLIMQQLLESVPFLIASRHLDSPVWKITTIGDPLMIMTPPKQ